jgi:peptidoglycan/LPS O-acetylase OafA/YrhL
MEFMEGGAHSKMIEKPQKMLVLEGIRGVAALMVIFDHLHLVFFVETDTLIERYLNNHVPFLVSKAGQFLTTGIHDGNFAVWVFWVMSAFVLSARYFTLAGAQKTIESRDYLFRSTVKRYLRLAVPILASTIFAYFLLSANLMTHLDLYARLGAHTSTGWLPTFYDFEPSLFSAVKSAVWDAFFDFNRDITYNTVLWTMKPEFFGSLFLFAFLSILGDRKVRFAVYPITIVVLYFQGLHWLNAIVAGIALCDVYLNSGFFPMIGKYAKNPVFQAAVGLGILILIGAPNYGDVLHLGIAILVVSTCLSFRTFAAVFSSAIPVYLGRISFSLYLIHVPILCSLTGFVYRMTDPYLTYPATAIVSSIITIAACLLAATVFQQYADSQGIKLGSLLANRLSRGKSGSPQRDSIESR